MPASLSVLWLAQSQGNRQGQITGMGNADRDRAKPQAGGNPRRAPMQKYYRLSAPIREDFHLLPVHVAYSGPQHFADRLLRGETPRQTVRLPPAVSLLGRCVYTVEKTLAPAVHRLGDPGDLGGVDPGVGNHRRR